MSLIVADAIERIRTAAEQHEVKVNFDEPETNQVVFGDRRQLISALHALLENAVVYSPQDGSVDIAVTRKEAAIDGDGETVGPCVDIEIRDQGVGIPDERPRTDLRTLLPCRPGPGARDRRDGTGLSIVRHVAQNHGGTVLVESREGEGSTFTLELPLNQQ